MALDSPKAQGAHDPLQLPAAQALCLQMALDPQAQAHGPQLEQAVHTLALQQYLREWTDATDVDGSRKIRPGAPMFSPDYLEHARSRIRLVLFIADDPLSTDGYVL